MWWKRNQHWSWQIWSKTIWKKDYWRLWNWRCKYMQFQHYQMSKLWECSGSIILIFSSAWPCTSWSQRKWTFFLTSSLRGAATSDKFGANSWRYRVVPSRRFTAALSSESVELHRSFSDQPAALPSRSHVRDTKFRWFCTHTFLCWVLCPSPDNVAKVDGGCCRDLLRLLRLCRLCPKWWSRHGQRTDAKAPQGFIDPALEFFQSDGWTVFGMWLKSCSVCLAWHAQNWFAHLNAWNSVHLPALLVHRHLYSWGSEFFSTPDWAVLDQRTSFIVTTTLLIESVGLSVGLMAPSASSLSSSTRTFSLTAIGHVLQGSLTGATSGSVTASSSPSRLPNSPSNTSWNSFVMPQG